MSSLIFRYEFEEKLPIQEIEATLVLAVVGSEALHGETATQLAVTHYLDTEKRVCVIDASETVARDFNALFAGFLRREFGPNAFKVSRVPSAEISAPAAA